jgi:anti-sigma-K factor RskA
VSGCASHGELLGGYALGALEPAEMEDMRRHVADCPHCGPEARDLGALPLLLNRIEPGDVPPPALPATVEEAVLDRFVRERASARRRRRPFSERARLTGPRIAVLAGAAAVAALAVALVWPGTGEDASGAYASAKLAPLAAGSDAEATAWVSEVPAGTRVRLRARDLPVRDGAMYELWCVRPDGRWVSGGTFRAARNGRAEAMLTAAVRPGDYHVVVVARHAGEDGGAKHGPALLRGRLRY